MALVERYKRPGAFGAAGLFVIERGERATLSYCPGVALDPGEVYTEDTTGLTLVHLTLYGIVCLLLDEKHTRERITWRYALIA